MDEESKISYGDLSELMKHNLLPKAEKSGQEPDVLRQALIGDKIEKQNKVIFRIIFTLLILSLSGIATWFLLYINNIE